MQFKILLISIFCILCFSNLVASAGEHISDDYQNVMQSVRKRNTENNILDQNSNSTQVDSSTLAPVPEVISDSDTINEIIKEVSQNENLYNTILSLAQTINSNNTENEYLTYINAVEQAIKIDGDITFKNQLQLNYILILEKLGYAYLKTSNFNKAIDVYEKLSIEYPNLIYKKKLVYLYDAIQNCETAKRYLNDIRLYEPLYAGNLVNCQISNQTSNYNNQITYQQPIDQKQPQKSYNIGWLIYIILFIFFAKSFSKKDNFKVEETTNVPKTNNSVRIKHSIASDDDYDTTWDDIKDTVYKKYGYKCSICGKTNNLQIHHKIPIKNGGTNDLFNLIPLCIDCHEKIHKFKIGNDNSDVPKNYGFNNKKQNIWIEAINKKSKIKIRYSASEHYKNGEVTERIIISEKILLGCEIDNEYINHSNYDKYKTFIKAFCLLRNDYRTFRLDRIKILEILD